MADTRLPFCSPYRLLGALLKAPQNSADLIHQAFARFAWRSMGIQHFALVAALGLAWPILFALMAFMFTRRIGPAVATRTGKSVPRQLAEQFWLALAHSIPPDKYYVFELYRDDRRAQANDYILRYELKGGLHNLFHFQAKQESGGASSKLELKDKLAFTRKCRAAGIDAPVVLAYLDEAARVVPEAHNVPSLPKQDIFIKPAKGKGGRGCEKWVYDGSGYRGPDGRLLSPPDLVTHISNLAAGRGRYL
ncbi:MAG: hypothetical protein JNL25_11965, partial [Rhodospirillaceae bacterium]|nr:hypothetical protein [Rhodospirillaceae bacterium]